MKGMKKNKIFDKEILDALYWIAFILCSFEVFFHTTCVEHWFGKVLFSNYKTWDILIYSLVISISMLRFSVQSKVTQAQRFLVWLIFFSFSFHYFATGRNMNVLVIGCLCIGAFNIPFQKIIKVFFWENLILYIFVCLAAQVGVIENRGLELGRAAMGFNHPNAFGARTLTLIMAYFVWRKAKVTWAEIGIAVIIELIIFRICLSRASFIGTMAFLFVCVLYKLYLYVKEKKAIKVLYNVITLCMCFSAFIFGGITMFLSYFYSADKEWMVKLDNWFSGRLRLARIGFDQFNATLLGNSIKMIPRPKEGEEYFYLDSYYIKGVLEWGILLFLVYLLMYFLVSYRAKQLDEFLILGAMSVMALYGIMEEFMGALTFNTYILFLFASTGTEVVQKCKGEIK